MVWTEAMITGEYIKNMSHAKAPKKIEWKKGWYFTKNVYIKKEEAWKRSCEH